MASFKVYYNGITLLNVLTREFTQSPVNDASGTDALFQKFRMSFETIANLEALSAAVQNIGISGAGVGGGNASQVMRSAELRLMEHRGEFVFYQDGLEILRSDANIDVDSGPHVIEARVTRFSRATVKIVFSIECSLVDCTNTPSSVISNRWGCADDIDENHVTTRTWRGRLRVSHITRNPHAFRNLVVPAIQLGWKRRKMSFVTDPGGLELAYEIEDRQLLGDAPPPYAIRMGGTQTESLNMGGQTGKANIVVRLDGPPGVDRRYLLVKACQIIHAKAAINSSTGGFFRELHLSENFGDDVNSVEVRAVVERWNQESSQLGEAGAMSLVTIGKPLRELNLEGYVDGAVWTAGAYGTATLAGLFICRLQTPCNDDHAMPQISGQQAEGSANGQGRDQEQTVVQQAEGIIPDDWGSIGYSDDHKQAVYSHAKIESHYVVNEGFILCPIAKGGGSFADNGDTLAAVRIHPRTATRRVRVELERVGSPPKIWEPANFTDSAGVVHYLKGFSPNFRPPESLGDGRTIYAVDADYLFGLSRPPKLGEYQTGSMPWDMSSASGNAFPQSAFIPLNDQKGIG